MGVRRLKITGIHPGIVDAKNWNPSLGFQGEEKMDEIHIFFSRPLSALEFSGIQGAIERAVK